MKKEWIIPGLTAAVILAAAAAGTGAPAKPETRTFFALDTVISLTGYGDRAGEALSEAGNGIREMENEWSATLPGSQVYRLNHGDGTPQEVGEPLLALLDRAEEMTALTGGAFDVTAAPAEELWGFQSGEYRVPSPEETEALTKRVGMEHLHRSGSLVKADEGTEADLGGIAKGYALEQIREVYDRYGLGGGIADLGGDILAYRTRPDGEPWLIAVRDPDEDESDAVSLGTLKAEDRMILTSGGYERYFAEDGKRYSHIIDPHTCRPAASGVQSVTIVTETEKGLGTAADALATALFVMGPEQAIRFWKESPIPFDLILADSQGNVFYTDGLTDDFIPLKPEKYRYLILHRE